MGGGGGGVTSNHLCVGGLDFFWNDHFAIIHKHINIIYVI